MRNVKPDILIGVSGQTGLFTEEIIREMHKHCERPIVMPLSNPTSRVEATPQDIIARTEGNALVATGSPFDPVVWKDKTYPIAQCNNSYIFPGIGLGVIASGASRITDEMLMSASETGGPLAAGERWRRTGAARAERHSQGVACYRVRGRENGPAARCGSENLC